MLARINALEADLGDGVDLAIGLYFSGLRKGAEISRGMRDAVSSGASSSVPL